MKTGAYGDLINRQRKYFRTGATLSVDYRRAQLKALRASLMKHEVDVIDAVYGDFKKPKVEAYTSEIGIIYADIDNAARNVKRWARPRPVVNPPVHIYTKSEVRPEPYGTALIISPWNYPVQLLLSPLVGAIAAGNTAVVKPSEISARTSSVINTIITDAFDPAYVACVEGGVDETRALLDEPFDYILYTGSTAVGKIIMEAAAKHPTPVTLELGGKSPCIVEDPAKLSQTARRIVWGKFFNAGQTCIAPDYVLARRDLKDELLVHMEAAVGEFYGDDPKQSPHYARIISDRHVDRLVSLIEGERAAVGGVFDKQSRYIAPTILDDVSPESKVMAEEIFGPVLPVLSYDTLTDAVEFVTERPRPLALYFFGTDKQKIERIVRETSSGGLLINDTIIQITHPRLPFGGVGPSGMGAYHGKASFDTFTHYRSVMRQTNLFDLTLRYPPYRFPFWFYRQVMKLFR